MVDHNCLYENGWNWGLFHSIPTIYGAVRPPARSVQRAQPPAKEKTHGNTLIVVFFKVYLVYISCYIQTFGGYTTFTQIGVLWLGLPHGYMGQIWDTSAPAELVMFSICITVHWHFFGGNVEPELAWQSNSKTSLRLQYHCRIEYGSPKHFRIIQHFLYRSYPSSGFAVGSCCCVVPCGCCLVNATSCRPQQALSPSQIKEFKKMRSWTCVICPVWYFHLEMFAA